jgi:hypothetical protein
MRYGRWPLEGKWPAQVRVIRWFVYTALALAALVSPSLASAQAPGSLAQLASPNDCLIAPVESNECQTSAKGLSQSTDAVVSSDGKNVYVIGQSDNAVAEFTRGPDGSLQQLAAPNDCIVWSGSNGSTCDDGTGVIGLDAPQAIAISPDGQNVYVAADDGDRAGDIVELARDSNGALAPISGHECIEENVEFSGESTPPCPDGGHGIQAPIGGRLSALAVSSDGNQVYAVDSAGDDIATFSRAADGSLSQPNDAGDCIEDVSIASNDCSSHATGLLVTTGVAISPHGENVYTVGWDSNHADDGAIAEFTRSPGGSLTQDNSSDCVETAGDDLGCAATAIGIAGMAGLVISPDGSNVYTASATFAGPIAEFSRDSTGALSQLPAPNDCIQEGGGFGCSTTGVGVASGYELAMSPDGATVYAAAPQANCSLGSCEDVAEFARNVDGSLTQLGSPDSCIQEHDAASPECPGNDNGHGLGGPGVVVSPKGENVYVTGGPNDTIAEFARTPVLHTLTVTLVGSGSGVVSDPSGMIACAPTCSHAYTANSQVTLSATPSSGSTFTGWSGACSGTGSCQVTMSSDMTVTATFTATASPTPGIPTPVVTGAPTAVTDAGGVFSGSANPEGLSTAVFFQYGLDRRYTQPGASGPDYTDQTPAQSIGSDFAVHGAGPVAVSGLLPNALYHVRLVATNAAGTTFGTDVTFTTAAAPAPPPPTVGQTFNIAPVSGVVLVLVHGQLVPLTQIQQLGPGVAIDSLHGTFQLITSTGGGSAHDAAATGKRAKTQTGQFGGAVVRLHQVKTGRNRGLTTVMMVLSAFKGAPSQATCNSPAGDAHAAKVSSKTLQLLHASAHGKFATSGRYSAATVRGTVWTMTARCDGTLTRDITDSVVVTDFIRHRTVVLHAGQSYLAPIRRRP